MEIARTIEAIELQTNISKGKRSRRRGTMQGEPKDPLRKQKRRTNVFVADATDTHTRMKGARRNRGRATDVEGEAILQ